MIDAKWLADELLTKSTHTMKKKLTLESLGFLEPTQSGHWEALYQHETLPITVTIRREEYPPNPIEDWDTGLTKVKFSRYCDDVREAVREHLGCPDKYVDDLFFAAYSDCDTTVYVFDLFRDPAEGFVGKDGRKLWSKAAKYTEAFRKGTWQQYLDGDVFWYDIEVFDESVGSLSNIYGFDYAIEEAADKVADIVKQHTLPESLKIETPDGSVLLNSEADFQKWCALLNDEQGECQGEPVKYPCVAWVHLTDDDHNCFHPVFLYPILGK